MSRKRKGRAISGILLLDKATGITSNKALQLVKHLYGAQKAGHTGSLDPLASGMLPICFGEATKFSQYLLDADKRYQVIASLGTRTDTGDSEGKVIHSVPPKNYNLLELEQVLDKFRGEIEQVPSMFSALKHQGQPLYKLARQGIEIERKARAIKIYDLKLINATNNTLELIVHCSKGTYIRNLIDDIGEVLGCGAHVTLLRRLQVSDYHPEAMQTFDQINALAEQGGIEALDKLLLPLELPLQHLPQVNVPAELGSCLRNGQVVQLSAELEPGQVRIVISNNQFLGIGEVNEEGKLRPKRLVSN